MNMRSAAAGFVLLAGILLAGIATAAGGRTESDVREITLKAAAFLEEKGIDAARKAFYAEGPFRHDEIYVNVIDGNGFWRIYPPSPQSEGRSVFELRDVDGKFLVQDILDVARTKGEGWVEYRWLNPVTNQIQPKVSYVKSVPGQGLIVYVGAYK
ncbi:MAG: cache domain-containing protein [Rhodospirillaceae bacterium]|nr:cache domain-containing protein [Rhodospirillaceae bacterium]